MSTLRILTATAAILASMGALPLFAQDNGPGRPPFLQRYPAYTAWHFDGRDDVRDFPTNGFFPGDFAAHPAGVAIGAAGIFGWTPRSPRLADESQPDPNGCARRYRSYNAASGSFRGHDGAWHRCR
jgi:BA14K-like protein